MDTVLVRQDVAYWKWQVTEIGTWAMFFAEKAVGEWWVEEKENGKIGMKWRYSYHAKGPLAQPFNWLFVRLFWRVVMLRGMRYIQEMAEGNAPFLYD